jgi:adenine phosphoribosyltransferase
MLKEPFLFSHRGIQMIDLKAHIRSVPDFPKKGILFYDIGTLLAHGPAWAETVTRMADKLAESRPDVLLGIESRGFLVGAAVAARLGIGFGMIRKKGKLPGTTIAQEYALEYGTDVLEMQQGVLEQGKKAVLVDDLLATGGTANAAISLAAKNGVTVTQAAFIIELTFLNGRAKLPCPAVSLLSYDQ